jgi:hypothetical protein
MSFKKNKYCVIKNILTKELEEFVYNYFMLKRQVTKTMLDARYISKFAEEWGTWTDEQVPNTYSHYADIAMETLLAGALPVMEKKTGLKLQPTYSYARIYKDGDILKRHKDRFSCEISTTLNLGGDPWPIYLNDGKKNIKVDLKPGDMLIYQGTVLDHWRKKFEGDHCCQVFLHYNNKKSKNAEKNLYDRRPHLGLPCFFKK